MPNIESPPAGSNALTFLRNETLIAFLKFCTVGVSNVLLDGGVAYVLTFHFHLHWLKARVVSFIISVSNSFYWNRRWTFKATDQTDVQRRYILFFVINAIGWVLNVSIQKSVMLISTGQWYHPLTKPLWIASYLTATAIGVFWNFFASKRWSFNK